MGKASVSEVRDELIRGNNDTLGELYLECKPYCKAYFNKTFRLQEADFEDIYVEAILVLRKNIIREKVNSFNSIKSYVLTICINHYKKLKSDKSKAQNKYEEFKSLIYIDHSEERDDLKDVYINYAKTALNGLSKKCKEILTYYYIYDMSMAEISENLGFSSSDVAKTSKSRCYKKWIELFKIESNGSK